MNAYARFVVGNRWLVLGICVVITGLAGASLTRATFGTSIGDQILGDKPEYDRYKELSEVFGNDEVVVVGLDDPDALTAEGQKRLKTALIGVEKLSDVGRVESLLSAQRVEGNGKDLGVTSYAEEALAEPALIPEIRKALQEDEFVGELFLSRDGRRHAVVVELTVNPSRPVEDLPHLVDDIRAEFAAAGYAAGSVHVVGWMTAAGESMRQVAFNLSVLLPLIAISLLLCVWILFRRFWPASISLGVAMVGVVWMMGFLTMIDPCIHGLVSLTPPVMLVVAFSDVVHLCSAYLKELEDGRAKKEAILASAGEVGKACFWTSATTFVGFGSMITVPDNSSRTLGLALAFGVASALLLAVTLAPILFTFMPQPKPLRRGVTGKAQAGLDRLLDLFRTTAQKWPRRVIAVFVLVAAIAGAGVPLASIEADFSNRFRDSHPLSVDTRWFEKHFAGTNSLELFVDSGEKDGLLDPERFARLSSYQERLRTLPNVDSVLSLVDLVKRIHEQMAPGLARESPVPDSRELLAQYLLMFEIAGGEDLDRLVDFERRKMRIGVRLGSTGARATAAAGQAAHGEAERLFDDGTEVEASGLVYLIGHFFETIFNGQKRGLIITCFVVMLMMMVGLRSIRGGVLSMIPNLLPLLVLAGAVGFTYDEVDSDVLLIAIMAIGIGVDDTIHFLTRYRVESARRGQDDAVRTTFAYSGRGILMTTIILVAGFLPCLISGFAINFMLGSLLPLCLITALLADVLLVPAMIRLGWMRL